MATSGGVAVDFVTPVPAPLYPDGVPPCAEQSPSPPPIAVSAAASEPPPPPQQIVDVSEETPKTFFSGVNNGAILEAPLPPPSLAKKLISEAIFIALVVLAVANVGFTTPLIVLFATGDVHYMIIYIEIHGPHELLSCFQTPPAPSFTRGHPPLKSPTAQEKEERKER